MSLKDLKKLLDIPKAIRKAVRAETGAELHFFPQPKPAWAIDGGGTLAVTELQLLWVQPNVPAQPAGTLEQYWCGDAELRVPLTVQAYKSTPTMRVENGEMYIYSVELHLRQQDIDWDKVERRVEQYERQSATLSALERFAARHCVTGLYVCTTAYVQQSGDIHFTAKGDTRSLSGVGQPTWHAYGGVVLSQQTCAKE